MRSENRTALASLTTAYDLDNEFAPWFLPVVNLIEGHDEIAISQFEADLESKRVAETAWVRELVTAARDPLTGQACLDRRIPQIIPTIPEEHARAWRSSFTTWYLVFGFPDRHYEIIFEAGVSDLRWTDADVQFWESTVLMSHEFVSHPRYLEVAEKLGFTDVWEQCGAPDFCNKVDTQWVCE